MKNNLRFIFPRFIGATLIVGLASLIMVVLFKLMLFIVFLGGVGLLVKRVAGGRSRGLGSGTYGRFASDGYGPTSRRSQWGSPITVDSNYSQKQTIVPIN